VKFSISDLVEGLCEMARKDAEAKSLYLHTSIDADIPEFVQGDSKRLQHVLFNIMMNAIKFTETGGVDIHVSRNNHDRLDMVSLTFAVRDTGIGISEEYKANLFKPLQSSDMSYARKHSGLGMGLAVSAGLVRLMGGEITCESRLGEGSVFKVRLTLSVPEETVKTEKTPQTFYAEMLSGMQVLVAEDNKINQMIMKALLTSVGIKTTFAENGIQVLEKLHGDVFDLILMDIQMPEMDGLTATAQIRSDHRYDALPILAMTANVGADFVAESESVGMNDYLTKPVDVEKLYNALIQWGKR
jgi:CheY-like chemotaxis protein